MRRRGRQRPPRNDCVEVDLPVFEGCGGSAREGEEGRGGYVLMRYTYALAHVCVCVTFVCVR